MPEATGGDFENKDSLIEFQERMERIKASVGRSLAGVEGKELGQPDLDLWNKVVDVATRAVSILHTEPLTGVREQLDLLSQEVDHLIDEIKAYRRQFNSNDKLSKRNYSGFLANQCLSLGEIRHILLAIVGGGEISEDEKVILDDAKKAAEEILAFNQM